MSEAWQGYDAGLAFKIEYIIKVSSLYSVILEFHYHHALYNDTSLSLVKIIKCYNVNVNILSSAVELSNNWNFYYVNARKQKLEK